MVRTHAEVTTKGLVLGDRLLALLQPGDLSPLQGRLHPWESPPREILLFGSFLDEEGAFPGTPSVPVKSTAYRPQARGKVGVLLGGRWH